MKIKMVAIDLDGTLINDKGIVSEKNIAILKEIKKKNILPVIATGRMSSEAWGAAEKIGATDFMISMNGCLVKDYPQGVVINQVLLPEDTALKIIAFLETINDVFYQVYSLDKPITSETNFMRMFSSGISEGYIKNYGLRQRVTKNVLGYFSSKTEPIYKFFIASLNQKALARIKKFAGKIEGVKAVTSFKNGLEIIPEKANKGKALEMLCRYLEMPLKSVMAIGDSENDLEIIRTAGLGVAMGNGFSTVKKDATWIVGSNEEDGVAEAIQKMLVLNKMRNSGE
ncbi:MAG: Cof-type HAD-IIB family hydrolase [Eubacteriaceae bacterium]